LEQDRKSSLTPPVRYQQCRDRNSILAPRPASRETVPPYGGGPHFGYDFPSPAPERAFRAVVLSPPSVGKPGFRPEAPTPVLGKLSRSGLPCFLPYRVTFCPGSRLTLQGRGGEHSEVLSRPMAARPPARLVSILVCNYSS
jgi:hypothetical protein